MPPGIALPAPVLRGRPSRPRRIPGGSLRGDGAGAARGGDGHGGGGGTGSREPWPLWTAVVVAVLLTVALTLIGMASQILANLAGSQLPGA